jgi:hypothetical protein
MAYSSVGDLAPMRGSMKAKIIFAGMAAALILAAIRYQPRVQLDDIDFDYEVWPVYQ